ncbi:hypothetical protein GW17_00045417 [Ensete ventricosum]|nr:hypothetical protein GW17_00045417 [Ensete ventricosum]
MKLQPDDGLRYSLGIKPSSDDAVRSRQKFARRFAEGIGKLARNAKGDRREEDMRTCRKIAGGCWSIRDERWWDRPYYRIRVTASRCRQVNRPNGGWTTHLTMTGAMELQPDDGLRSSLGIRPGSDDEVRPCRKFTRRFIEGIRKLAWNTPGDHRKKTRRLCRKLSDWRDGDCIGEESQFSKCICGGRTRHKLFSKTK